MLIRRFSCLLLLIGLPFVRGLAQIPPESTPLSAGQSVEREIAGGESHTYQISLAAGQFMRVVAEQKNINVALKIAAPDGKQLIEANFGDVGELESLSVEAATGGEHRLTISARGAAGSRATHDRSLPTR